MDNESTHTLAGEQPQSFQTQSSEINELAGALSLAQGEMSPAKKGANNPFFKSKYADLAEVIEASRYPLSSNDLSIAQYCEDGYVVTQLMHSSGQWLRGRLRIQPKDNTPQGIGSALSYSRRYSLQMMICQASGDPEEDADGEAAMGRAGSAYAPAPAPPAPKKKAPRSKAQWMHRSGQWLRGRWRIQPKDNTPQGIGSALTYARRYSWQMMVGLGAEDDDGEAAMGRAGSAYDPAHAKPAPKKKATRRKAPAKKKTAPATEVIEDGKGNSKVMTLEQEEKEESIDRHEPKTKTVAEKKEEPKTETVADAPKSLAEEVDAIVNAVDKGKDYLKFHDVDPQAIPEAVQERIMSKGLDGFGEMVATWAKENGQ